MTSGAGAGATILTPFFLVRHAPVAEVAEGLYRDADMEAALPSTAILRTMAEALPDDALWYVSPRKRTLSTAKALQSIKDQVSETHVMDAIAEQEFGRWQGLGFDALWREIKDLPAHNWSLLAADTRPPGGESFCDLQDRTRTFMAEAARHDPGKPKVLVTHAGIIRAFVGLALGLDPNHSAALGVAPFSVSHLLHQTGAGQGGQWQLVFSNKTFEDT